MTHHPQGFHSRAEDVTRKETLTVTQPYLPPLEEFLPYLEEIWRTKTLTNGGPFHKRLEAELATYLGVPYVSLFTNATIALVTALQALRISGEVITTPYSFVATAHSLLWNGIKPVFVDIDPKNFNIDPIKIEAAITPHTTAIMPVHCYGQPCDIDAIQEIANNYNLKVIYDAAHAFGVKREGLGSILNAGDLSVLSFHATKVFNTFEGGAIICRDARTKQHIDHLKNFGFAGETTVVAAGINGKMSEFNAALGLVQLKHMQEVVERRAHLSRLYRQILSHLPGIKLLEVSPDVTHNYSYFPVFIGPEFPLTRNEVYESLKHLGIYGRRYFYPLISEFPMYRGLSSAQSDRLPIAHQASQRVICLPLYPALSDEEVCQIAEHIVEMACRDARAIPTEPTASVHPLMMRMPTQAMAPSALTASLVA
jgi:dTDP-4-amino-4,6-dideoxygalactose transaminase